jgi:hypothetical protein
MALLFQSFLLSFKTFLRYLIVMPFVVIPGALIVMTLMLTPLLMTRGLILIIFLFAPILFSTLIIIIFAFLITALSSFNVMIGCRAAFGSMGRHNDLDFGRLVAKSFAFTFAQLAAGAFIALILGGIVAAIFVFSQGGEQFLQNPAASPEFVLLFVMDNPAVVVIAVLSVLLSIAVAAVLAVPMAGAAISATPKMGPTDAFIGVGTAFVPILLLLIGTSVVLGVTGAYQAVSMLMATLATTFAQHLGGLPLVWPTLEQMLMGVGMFLFIVWTSCWFYAAAALGWRNYTDNREASLAVKRQVERFEPEDLRALREKRERDRLATV